MNIDDAIKAHSGSTKFAVYLLINKGAVVYVGSSRQVSSRIYSHKVSDKEFDSVRVTVCASMGDMYEMESEYIMEFNPVSNKNLPANDKYRRTGECARLASAAISGLVKDLPKCFSRSAGTYISTEVYDEFISALDGFAVNKISELVEAAHKKECKSQA